MKLLRVGEPGKERAALLDAGGRLRDLSMLIADVGGEALLPENLARLAAADAATLPVIEAPCRIGPCVGGVGKIICVGLNYRDHAAEANLPPPAEPILFMKPTSAIIGAEDDVEIPPGSQKTDWEVELGIVIGRPGRYLSREQAMSHVAGYCLVNDLSERAYTGTPAGVGLGQRPPRFLKAGQILRAGIAGLGTQTQRTVPAAV